MPKKPISTRFCLTKDQHEWLQDEAQHRDSSMAEVIRELIDEKRNIPKVRTSGGKVLHA